MLGITCALGDSGAFLNVEEVNLENSKPDVLFPMIIFSNLCKHEDVTPFWLVRSEIESSRRVFLLANFT